MLQGLAGHSGRQSELPVKDQLHSVNRNPATIQLSHGYFTSQSDTSSPARGAHPARIMHIEIFKKQRAGRSWSKLAAATRWAGFARKRCVARDADGLVAVSTSREETRRAPESLRGLRIRHSCRQRVTVESHWHYGGPWLAQGLSVPPDRTCSKNTNGKAAVRGIH